MISTMSSTDLRKQKREERRHLIREWWQQHFQGLVQGQVSLAKIMGYDDAKLQKLASKGLRLFKVGKLDNARKIFRGLVILDPWVPYFHYLLGSAYEKLGNFENAWREYARAIELTEGMQPVPDVVPFAMLGQGRMLGREGQLEPAISVLSLLVDGRYPAADPTVLETAGLMCRHFEEQLAARS